MSKTAAVDSGPEYYWSCQTKFLKFAELLLNP